MSFDLPPIIKLAERVRAMVEQAVATWARSHRYAHGATLRQQAQAVVKAVHVAWVDRAHRGERLAALSAEIDSLKMDLRLAQHIKIWRSFGQFEDVYRQALELGRQCGAMLRALQQQPHSKGQNAGAPRAPAARPDTEYSARLAHHEASR